MAESIAIPFRWRALHLIGMCIFSVAQPVFNILALHGEFFAVRQTQPVDLFLLVFVLSLAVPAPLIGVSAAAGWIGARTGTLVQVVLISLLASLTPLPVLVRYGSLEVPFILIACLLTGVAIGFFYYRFVAARQFLSFVAVAALSLPLFFLFDPAIRKTAFPSARADIQVAEITSDLPVVMVIFDEFPTSSILDGHSNIDEGRLPNFASLARESVWFRNATVVATNTITSIPSILTGRNPEAGLHPTLNDHPRNLMTLLEADYRITAFEPLTSLASPGPGSDTGVTSRLISLFQDLQVIYLHLFLPSEWGAGLPPINQGWGDFAALEREDKKKQLKRFRKRNEKTQLIHMRAREFSYFAENIDSLPQSLWFMHSVLPHAPHNIYPSGRYYSLESTQPSGEDFQRGLWSHDDWAVSQAYQRHLLQVGLADSLTGLLIERLKRLGLWDKAIIIITADHGISFRKGDSRRSITDTNFADIISVPLFVRAPGLTVGRVDDNLVRSTDILPTIVDLLGVESQWQLDGMSLFDPSIALRKITHTKDDDSTRAFTRDAIQRGRTEAVAARLAIFDNAYPSDLYKMGPFGHLVGRGLDSLPVSPKGGIRGRIETPDRYADVSLRDRVLPGQLVGRIEIEPEDPLPWVAVAVNGVIRAVTRPYRRYRDQAEILWAAILSESALVDGRNDIQLFTLAITPGEPLSLRPIEHSGASTDFRGITLGVAPIWGVREHGFHGAGFSNGEPRRWTNGNALLEVPIDPDDPPETLEVTLLGWGPNEVRNLKIIVNDTELYSGPALGKVWTKTLQLGAIEPKRTLTIEILSETWGPKNNKGVLVRKITLR